jgi:hypothetical protein
MIDTLTKNLPPMLFGEDLMGALISLPEYNIEIRNAPAAARLISLSDLYQLYLPSTMSVEIYHKLYLSTCRSLQQKETIDAIRQLNMNRKAIRGEQAQNALCPPPVSSFTLLAPSGFGKTTAVKKAIALITGNQIIEAENPHRKIIPILQIQTPFDSSVKSMLLAVLQGIDNAIETNYFSKLSQSGRATTDALISGVANAALLHVGTLILDECQQVANSRNGKVLVGALTQLYNSASMGTCLVGTPDCAAFFEQSFILARRSTGLRYDLLPFDDYFKQLCSVLFQYQYTRSAMELTDGLMFWLYEHSMGLVSNLVALVHDAQEISIINGRDVLDMAALNESYQKRLTMLHGYIESRRSKPKVASKPPKPKNEIQPITLSEVIDEHFFAKAALEAKRSHADIVALLRDKVSITEISLL